MDQPEDDKTRTHVPRTGGTMISHYRIIEKIGAGGMGEVYLAEDTKLNRKVALKFLPPHLCQDAECRARFKREAQAAARLSHSNIITIFEVSEFNGHPYFAMERLEGLSLRELIKDKNTSLPQAVDIAVQLCEGLHEAHTAGIVHRDIKPSNVIIDKKGHCKILDFGLAAVAGTEPLTETGSTVGTAAYMSPEQTRGEVVDARSDLFSLGTVIYELITGKSPFKADTAIATLRNITDAVPEPLARYKTGIPDALQHVIDRALEKDAAIRYQSAADMMADLRRLRRRSSDTSQHTQPLRPSLRRRVMSARLFVPAVTAVLVAFALWWIYHPGVPGKSPNRNHLAVIPFANLTGQSTSRAFCDGLMETIASKLTELAESEGTLLVVPASEIREKDIKSAAQARRVFGVNLVVTGSVQQMDGTIRTTLNLVDAASERQLRSTVLDERKDDILSHQDSSVAEVARLLDIQLGPESRHALQEGGTVSSRAYSSYLEGQGYLQRYDDARSLDSARQFFDMAIKLDSGYALAYAGLGGVFWQKFNLTNDVSWLTPAILYSSRALELNDHLAPVLVTLGMVHRATGQYQEAVSYLKRALQIDSVDNEACIQLASAYESLGRVAEAESTYQKSVLMRPDYWRTHYNLARFYAFRGQKSAAMNEAIAAEAVAPEATFPYESLGSLYTFLAEYDRARVLLQRSLGIEPNYIAYSNLGAIFQMEKEYRKAAEMYELALKLNDKDYRVWSNLAWMYKNQPDGQAKATAAYNRAIELAEQASEVNPNNPGLMCYLAGCYWKIEKRDTALALAQQAVQLAPDDVEIMFRAGTIFEEAGQRNEALRLVGEAARRGFSLEQIRSTEELQKLVRDPRFDSILAASR